MKSSSRQGLFLAGMAAIACAVTGAAIDLSGFLSGRGFPVLAGMPIGPLVTVLGTLGVGWIAFILVDGHFDEIEKLRAAALTGRFPPVGTGPGTLELGGETARLYEVMRLREERMRAAMSGAAHDARLSAVLASVDEAIVVVTGTGQVSLVNSPAKALLGADAVGVGTSVFAALYRHEVSAALTEVRMAKTGKLTRRFGHLDGRILTCTLSPLPGEDGAVLRFDCPDAMRNAETAEIDLDLDLHDRPPEGGYDEETLLEVLPALVYDSETTGLDVVQDSLLAAGGVRMQGRRVYRAACFDLLVNPGRPIPPRSTAIHGITDAMVAQAPGPRAVLPRIRDAMTGCVLIGHNIGFDAAILQAEAGRTQLDDWPADPDRLCTLQLSAALWPEMTDLNLDTIAARLGVDVRGRHTALGDALVTAEIWACLIPLLADAGVRTLAQARAFAAGARRVRKLQQAAGW